MADRSDAAYSLRVADGPRLYADLGQALLGTDGFCGERRGWCGADQAAEGAFGAGGAFFVDEGAGKRGGGMVTVDGRPAWVEMGNGCQRGVFVELTSEHEIAMRFCP